MYEDLAQTKDKNPFRDASRISLAQLLSNSNRKKEEEGPFAGIQKEQFLCDRHMILHAIVAEPGHKRLGEEKKSQKA